MLLLGAVHVRLGRGDGVTETVGVQRLTRFGAHGRIDPMLAERRAYAPTRLAASMRERCVLTGVPTPRAIGSPGYS